jgi:phosphoribosylaminoimidazole carboxylase PurE protein
MALVGILMGSDSDLEVMRSAADALAELGIPYEATVLSAHRTPDKAADYARTAADRGLKIIIAGAGAAAHLPGVLAAFTTLPIIGVPIDATPLRGADALYAIVQMPPGIPVATVGINNARNAGLLAAEILALSDPGLGDRLVQLRADMARKVEERARKVEQELQSPN